MSVAELESGQAPLERSIEMYERGAALKAHCEQRLAAARLRVEKIVAAGARSSSSKIPGRVGRVFQEAMLRAVFRFLVNDARQAWMTGHRSPVLAAEPEGTPGATGASTA